MRGRFVLLGIAAAIASAGYAKGGPSIGASSAVLIEASTGRVLWGKNERLPHNPASTTKIMTALLLLEHADAGELVQAPKDTEEVTGSSLHLVPGEKISAREALFAMMLRSANDVCHAVAVHLAGSDQGFAKLMNERAAALGCTDTHFVTPHGLHDEDHKTTAYDLALIAREAMRYPDFRTASATRRHLVERDTNKEDRLLISKNPLLRSPGYGDGIKTGYTNEAGRCLVGTAVRDGMRLISVVLKSPDMGAESKAVLDWGFANFEIRPVAIPGQVLAKTRPQRASISLEAGVETTKFVLAKKGGDPIIGSPEFVSEVVAPVDKGEQVGTMVYTQGGEVVGRIPLVANKSVPVSLIAASSAAGRPMFVAGVILTAYAAKRRRRPNRRPTRA